MLSECVGGIPLEVLLRSAAGAQSEIYIWQITPASDKAATIELLDLTIDVENDWNLFVFNYSQIVYYSVEDSAVLEHS